MEDGLRILTPQSRRRRRWQKDTQGRIQVHETFHYTFEPAKTVMSHRPQQLRNFPLHSYPINFRVQIRSFCLRVRLLVCAWFACSKLNPIIRGLSVLICGSMVLLILVGIPNESLGMSIWNSTLFMMTTTNWFSWHSFEIKCLKSGDHYPLQGGYMVEASFLE